MTLYYNDPWKDEKFARITGDFTDTNAKVAFSEARVYPVEEGYTIAGWFTWFAGITPKFKPERKIEPGLCSITIHDKEYTVNHKKDDGTWEKIKYQPSKFEKMLCEDIAARKEVWLPEGKGIQGQISFLPDMYIQMMEDTNGDRSIYFPRCIEIETVDWTGEFAWEPAKKKGNGSKFSNSQSNTFLSPEERLEFVRTQLLEILGKTETTEKMTVVKLLKEIYTAHPAEDSPYVDAYIKVLLTVAR